MDSSVDNKRIIRYPWYDHLCSVAIDMEKNLNKKICKFHIKYILFFFFFYYYFFSEFSNTIFFFFII